MFSIHITHPTGPYNLTKVRLDASFAEAEAAVRFVRGTDDYHEGDFEYKFERMSYGANAFWRIDERVRNRHGKFGGWYRIGWLHTEDGQRPTDPLDMYGVERRYYGVPHPTTRQEA